ncbi:MAG: hypothetical protein ACK4FP_05065 [Azonexus sp.]
MATPKKAAATEAEKVVMVAVEPIKHDGQSAKPGELFMALPDDIEALIAAGLAQVAAIEPKPTE